MVGDENESSSWTFESGLFMVSSISLGTSTIASIVRTGILLSDISIHSSLEVDPMEMKVYLCDKCQ